MVRRDGVPDALRLKDIAELLRLVVTPEGLPRLAMWNNKETVRFRDVPVGH